MTRKQRYTIVYASQVKDHLQAIEVKYYSLIRDTIDEQLQHEPDVPTRNRKRLKTPLAFEADWELRLGPANRFRALYKIDTEEHRVVIVAVGVKRGNQLVLGGTEI